MQKIPFKQLMKEKRTRLELSQKELANLTSITPALISKYENGLSKPRIETAKRIAEVLHIDLDTLIKSLDQDEIYLVKIPFYLNEEEDSGYFYIASDMLPSHIDPDNLLAYRQKGNSMVPLFQDGDLLLINKLDKKVNINLSFLLEIDGYSGVKQVSINDFSNEYIVNSLNPNYQSIYIKQDKADIIGRVIWCSRFI
ncbi:XRE family transcriptional regulator [Aggregatibacter actinomycetemcomitans]|uniref:XRE family transcriptional regulator n=1 Tax=Aggregatibacter actinomycetemcomitans TaxID=714 RepID=UPI0002400855|nr:helix-turn-helix domain-containing protein [Aggregatibacter actinomycetemcomitans]EHK89872.1 DNA-binding protein RDGA [Aggregatibacter actinomycetemcomitans RhAA1]MBN6080422.1 helix-turn-helix domain-containing protein [Aggregatibacter actinomycetemcomitans]